jgi:tRNA pseudouridine38-40 synthase
MSDRFQAILTYDGTEFHGSQYQLGQRTVQGELQNSLAKLGWKENSVLFAGRTDTGVHASGQVIAFNLKWDHTEKELNQALNAVLPKDISALKVSRTRQDFHPRYDALSREYHYQIFIGQNRDPLQERYSWRVWPEVDPRLMNRAARYLLGKHDFNALGISHQPGGSTIREIFQAAWKKKQKELVFRIIGNAFLYHMVRRIVLVLVRIGQGWEPADSITNYLKNPSGPPAQGLAPAQGLHLVRVRY